MNIRTTKPSNNKFYQTKSKGGYSTCIKGKPTDASCDVLANCVGYACGRFNEIIGKMKYPQLNCNAENFIKRAKSIGLKVVSYPTLGGIMVWQKGSTLSGKDGAGHVAIVERIDGANQIYTSESGYGNSAFWNSIRKNSNGRWGLGSGYKFIGCIINPAIGDVHYVAPAPKPSPKKSIDEIAKDVISGKYGNYPERKTKLEAEGYNYSEVQNKVNKLLSGNNHKPSEGFKVGDYVVPTKLVDYKGTRLIKYDEKYQIIQKDSRGNVLGAVRGSQRPIWAVLPDENIKKVG